MDDEDGAAMQDSLFLFPSKTAAQVNFKNGRPYVVEGKQALLVAEVR